MANLFDNVLSLDPNEDGYGQRYVGSFTEWAYESGSIHLLIRNSAPAELYNSNGATTNIRELNIRTTLFLMDVSGNLTDHAGENYHLAFRIASSGVVYDYAFSDGRLSGFTYTWDDTIPAGSAIINTIDDGNELNVVIYDESVSSALSEWDANDLSFSLVVSDDPDDVEIDATASVSSIRLVVRDNPGDVAVETNASVSSIRFIKAHKIDAGDITVDVEASVSDIKSKYVRDPDDVTVNVGATVSSARLVIKANPGDVSINIAPNVSSIVDFGPGNPDDIVVNVETAVTSISHGYARDPTDVTVNLGAAVSSIRLVVRDNPGDVSVNVETDVATGILTSINPEKIFLNVATTMHSIVHTHPERTGYRQSYQVIESPVVVGYQEALDNLQLDANWPQEMSVFLYVGSYTMPLENCLTELQTLRMPDTEFLGETFTRRVHFNRLPYHKKRNFLSQLNRFADDASFTYIHDIRTGRPTSQPATSTDTRDYHLWMCVTPSPFVTPDAEYVNFVVDWVVWMFPWFDGLIEIELCRSQEIDVTLHTASAAVHHEWSRWSS